MWNNTLKLRRPPGKSLVYPVHARTCSTPHIEDSLCLNIPWRTQIIYKVKASAATCLTGSPGSFYETWKQAAIVRKRGCADQRKKKKKSSKIHPWCLWDLKEGCDHAVSLDLPLLPSHGCCSGKEILPVSRTSVYVNTMTAKYFYLSNSFASFSPHVQVEPGFIFFKRASPHNSTHSFII